MELYEDYSLIETHTQVKIKKKETVKNKEHLKEKVESSTQFFESNLKSRNSKKKQTEIPYECTSSQPIFKPLTINLSIYERFVFDAIKNLLIKTSNRNKL